MDIIKTTKRNMDWYPLKNILRGWVILLWYRINPNKCMFTWDDWGEHYCHRLKGHKGPHKCANPYGMSPPLKNFSWYQFTTCPKWYDDGPKDMSRIEVG